MGEHIKGRVELPPSLRVETPAFDTSSVTSRRHISSRASSHPSSLTSILTTPTPSTMALDLEKIDRSMSFHPSEATTISCGTVTIDTAARKVLLIWNRKLAIYQLPKGRKNIGEDMLSAAMRETYEETGV